MYKKKLYRHILKKEKITKKLKKVELLKLLILK